MIQAKIKEKTNLVVHRIQPMSRNNIPSMDQPIQRTRTLSQVRIVRIIGTDPIEDQIEAVRKVGNAGP